MSSTTIDNWLFQKTVEIYGIEAAVKWANFSPESLWTSLVHAFMWDSTQEWSSYWKGVRDNRNLTIEDEYARWERTIGQPSQPITPSVTPQPKVPKTPSYEERVKAIREEREATNKANRAVHEEMLRLAAASKRKIEKKVAKLGWSSGEEVVVEVEFEVVPV